MDPILLEHLHGLRELVFRLLALDRLLGSVPLHQQQDLHLDTIFSEDAKAAGPCPIEYYKLATPYRYIIELYNVVDVVPRFDRIPATLVDICKTTWQGRIYQNVCRHSDINKPRDPTCSEVLQLLPKLDILLETALGDKINAILNLLPPFRFLDLPTELRLHAYAYILPRQPYLTLLNIEPCRYALPRYDLAVLRICWQIHNELVDHFYKDQVLVMNFYDIRNCSWAFQKNSPRDRLIVHNMRRETRSCLKKLEIRVLDMDEPNNDRKGSYWEANITDIWDLDEYFTETLEGLSNLESATVSFEIGENKLEYWTGWYHALGHVAQFLISNIPERIQIRWDFHPTSDPELQELAEEEEHIMDEIKTMVAEETAKRGGTVQLGTRLIKDRIIKAASLE